MVFKTDLKQFNIEYSDIKYLMFLAGFSIILVYLMIDFNLKLGIYCSDVLVYLTNSMRFAGVNLGLSSNMYLSPVICILTSLLIRLGLEGELSIYIVTGVFAIFGNIGLYLLLKTRFDSLLSFTGAILFSSFSLNLLWLANGTLDIPAVALSIWAILFTILGFKNSRLFIFAMPIWVLAVFTRYTALLIFAFMILYYLFEKDFIEKVDLLLSNRELFIDKLKDYLKSQEFKNILIGAIISIILLFAFFAIIHLFGSRLTFLYQGSNIASGAKGSVIDKAYTTDTFFYIHNFLSFLFAKKVVFIDKIPVLIGASPFAYIMGIIFILALVLKGMSLLGHIDFKFFDENNYNWSILKNKYLFALSLFLLVLICIFFKLSIVASIALLFTLSIVLKGIFKNKDCIDLNLLFCIWFLSYLLFFTFLDIKVNRYIITALPAFVYLFLLALEYFLDCLKGSFRLNKIVPVVLILLALFSAFAFTSTVELDDTIKSPEIMADYLLDLDENLSSHQVAVYNVRYFDWFLEKKTIPMEDDNLDVLDSSNITYFISDNKVDLNNFTMIHKENNLYLYKHN